MQWLAPGILVAVVLAMGQVQRADIRQLSGKIDQIRTDLSTDIREPSDRIDQTNDCIDQLFQLYQQPRSRARPP